MYRFSLLVVAVTLLRGSVVHAASYTETDGTVVDPILDTSGIPHSHSGNNLEPGANLENANLEDAFLDDANLVRLDREKHPAPGEPLRYFHDDEIPGNTGRGRYCRNPVAGLR